MLSKKYMCWCFIHYWIEKCTVKQWNFTTVLCVQVLNTKSIETIKSVTTSNILSFIQISSNFSTFSIVCDLCLGITVTPLATSAFWHACYIVMWVQMGRNHVISMMYTELDKPQVDTFKPRFTNLIRSWRSFVNRNYFPHRN